MKIKIIILFLMVGHVFSVAQEKLSFTEIANITQTDSILQIAWGDLDQDGGLDLIVNARDVNGNTHLSIYANQQGENWLKVIDLPTASMIQFELADMNNDNRVDIIFKGSNAQNLPEIGIYYNTDNFNFSLNQKFVAPIPGEIKVADLNQDGKKDIFYFASDTTLIYENSGAGFTPSPLHFGHSEMITAQIFDYNSDGYPDILLSGRDQDKAAFSAIHWQQEDHFDSAFLVLKEQFEDIILANLNGNDDIDLISQKISDDDVHTNIHFDPMIHDSIATLNGIVPDQSIAVGDLTHDGLMDILLKNDTASLLLTSETGFQIDSAINLSSQLPFGKYYLGDVDQDNDLDVAVIQNSDTGSVISIFNNENPIENIRPSAPPTFYAINDSSETLIRWSGGSDDTTPAQSLSYNLFIYAEERGFKTTLEADANMRSVVNYGNQGLAKQYVIRNLPEGRYYYDAITIDNSFAPSLCEGGRGAGNRCFTFEIDHKDTLFCYGDTLKLFSKNGKAVTWYSSNYGALAYADSLNYRVVKDDIIYYNFENQYNCTETYSLPFKVSKLQPETPSDTTICEPVELDLDTLQMDYDVTQAYSLQTQKLINNPTSLILNQTDTLVFTLKNEDGCVANDTFKVNFEEPVNIQVSESQIIQQGESVQLFATGGVDYSWSPSNGLDQTQIANPVATPNETTTYQVEIITEWGCVVNAAVKVTVNQVVFIPNLFSPNMDGNNDAFKVYGENIEEIRLTIFSRNGKVVYETSDVRQATQIGWDGTWKGNELPSGTYLWSVEGKFRDGGNIQTANKNTGNVSLIR